MPGEGDPRLVEAVDRTVARALGRRPAVLVGALSGARSRVVAGGDVRADALVEIGSLTKVLTATLLADLVIAGTVGLETPVRDLLPPGCEVPHRDGVQITLEHLATHRSGVPRTPVGLGVVTGTLDLLRGRNPYAGFGEAELLGSLSRTHLDRVPGTGRPAYSNTGFALLGLALGRVTGLGYDESLATRVCAPLGLQDTVTDRTATADHRARWVHGTRRRGAAAQDWVSDGIAGAGVVRSTVADVLRLLRVQVDPAGSPLEAAVRLTQEPRAGSGAARQCLGWQLHAPDGDAPVWWHNGGTGGFRSLACFAAGPRAAAVVLTPSTRGVDLLGLRLLRDLCEG